MFWTPSPRRSVPGSQSLDSGMLEEEEEKKCSGLPVPGGVFRTPSLLTAEY